MATEVVMPKLGLTMETGTIGSWLVSEGEAVVRGAPLLEVVTDKVTMEVEAQASGVLRRILVPAGEEVAVATPVGIIADAEEEIGDFESQLAAKAGKGEVGRSITSEHAPVSEPPPAVSGDSPAPGPVSPSGHGRPHRASPKARKMADALGLDLASIQGSGPGGRIVSSDLKAQVGSEAPKAVAAPEAPASAASPVAVHAPGTVELTRAQQVAAERLTASYQQIPHIHIGMEISGVWLQQFRQGYAIEGKKISYNDLILQAVGRVLEEQPRFNSVLNGTTLTQLGEVNIGIAADTTQGLMVPVVRDVPNLSLEQIAAESRRLVDAARNGRLQPDDMAGGTFTISNLGMLGVSRFTAIINPPQVAILAVGALEDRVVAIENHGMAVRPQMSVTLAADHRALDGAACARFLGRLKETLETPGLLA
jgi:pyruvate dehydrogenase E2 component (dihydrolipoamide acetyltransferase)